MRVLSKYRKSILVQNGVRRKAEAVGELQMSRFTLRGCSVHV